jgi:ectoine hydroxylase-related dioxygenase (phytanoyl-CoA dioxygenase family)
MTSSTAIAPPLSDGELAAYREQGFLLVPELIPRRQVDAFLEHEGAAGPEAGPRGLQHHRSDPVWRDIASHPEVVTRVRQMIGGEPQIVQTMYMAKEPGGGTGVALHQDTHYIRNEPNTLMACWIAFNDTGADNGGLCVVPGSHRQGLQETGRVREVDQHASWENDYEMSDRDGKVWTERMHSHDIHAFTRDQVQMLSVPCGGGVFFTSLTVHGSYANETDDRARLAFATHYVRDATWVYRRDLQGMVSA